MKLSAELIKCLKGYGVWEYLQYCVSALTKIAIEHGVVLMQSIWEALFRKKQIDVQQVADKANAVYESFKSVRPVMELGELSNRASQV